MLEDYIDVAERIAQFYEKFPDGRLVREGDPYVMTMGADHEGKGGKQFLVYNALAYRDPEDPHPAPGTAWEPWPGPTPFTLDSELMNAETAAIGRSIVMVGIPSKKIASAEELLARGNTQANGRPDRPQVPDTYEEALRMSIRHYDKTELDDKAWEEMCQGDVSTLAEALSAKLVDLGGDPEKVRTRWEQAHGVKA